jgi:putative transposase
MTTCLIESPLEVSRYDLGGHTHYKLDYHSVWRTKFNRKILGPVLAPFLVDQIGTICKAKEVKRLGLAIAANHGHLCVRLRPSQSPTICKAKEVKRLGLAIAANHGHLCVRLRPSQSPTQVMRWIKATTSKNAFEQFPQLESRFGLRHLWGRGYHVESLGERPVFAILAYLGRQDEKHDLRGLEGYFAMIEAFLTQAVQDDERADEPDMPDPPDESSH